MVNLRCCERCRDYKPVEGLLRKRLQRKQLLKENWQLVEAKEESLIPMWHLAPALKVPWKLQHPQNIKIHMLEFTSSRCPPAMLKSAYFWKIYPKQ